LVNTIHLPMNPTVGGMPPSESMHTERQPPRSG